MTATIRRPPPTPHGPTPDRWVWPSMYDALDRIERELVEDVAAAILAAKRQRARR